MLRFATHPQRHAKVQFLSAGWPSSADYFPFAREITLTSLPLSTNQRIPNERKTR